MCVPALLDERQECMLTKSVIAVVAMGFTYVVSVWKYKIIFLETYITEDLLVKLKR